MGGRRRALGLPRPAASRHDAVLARPLGVVERAVGGRHDRVTGRHFGEGGDAQADGDVDVRPVRREDRPLLERDPGALGQARRALQVGAGQDDGELLPAPARRHVDLAHALAQRLRELDEDAVADWVAEAVVDRLEAVEISQYEGDRAAEALGAHQLPRACFLTRGWLAEAGENAAERLPRDDPVQARVLERDRRVRDERRRGAPLLDGEAAAGERERAEALTAGRQGQLEAAATLGEGAGLDDLTAETDDEATRRPGRLDDRLDDQAQELVDVVRGGERLAEADGRVAQARALGVELLHPRLELVGHLVERDSEAGELVAPVDLDPAVEAASRDRV